MNANADLEDRLRRHYAATAARVPIEPLDLDRLDERSATVRLRPPARRRGRWLAVAATVVVLAGVAATVALARGGEHDHTPASAVLLPVVCPAENPPVAATPSTTNPPVTTAATPVGVGAPGAAPLLPASDPSGMCATHIVTYRLASPQRRQVWADCACDRPTAAISITFVGTSPPGTPGTTEDIVRIGGRSLVYDDAMWPGFARLSTQDDRSPEFSIDGWGLSRLALTDIASALIAGDTELTGSGLQLLFDGGIGASLPGVNPLDGDAVQLGYVSTDRTRGLEYAYEHGPDALPLDTALWFLIDARRTTIDGQPALVSETATATRVLLRPDDHTMILLGSWAEPGTEPLTVAELAALPLTPAGPDDPRWDAVADAVAANGPVLAPPSTEP